MPEMPDSSTLIGAGTGAVGITVLMAELARLYFANRAGQRADDAAVRGELYQQVKDLRGELTKVNERLDQAQADYFQLKANNAILEEQNKMLLQQNTALLQQNTLLQRRVQEVEETCKREHAHLTPLDEHRLRSVEDRANWRQPPAPEQEGRRAHAADTADEEHPE